jgi:nucleoside-diphosphate-sugar epimerase
VRLPAEFVHAIMPRLAGKHVGITGGAGFIGGHLASTLLSLGCSISIIDDLSNSTAEHIVELAELEPKRVKFVHGSILDDAALAEALAGCELIFHQAAVGSVPLSIQNPERSWTVNAHGTLRVLQKARVVGASRVIYASSSSVYGESMLPAGTGEVAGLRRESLIPMPVSPYGASKLAGEVLLRAWCRSFGISGVSLRYFNVFGPRQASDSAYAAVVAAFSRRLLNNQPPVVFGDGKVARDFTPVASVVAANLLAATSSKLFAGQAFNIGTGHATDIASLAARMAQRAGVPQLMPEFAPPRPGDVAASVADISEARRELGYNPIGTLDDALGETIGWYRSRLSRVS